MKLISRYSLSGLSSLLVLAELVELISDNLRIFESSLVHPLLWHFASHVILNDPGDLTSIVCVVIFQNESTNFEVHSDSLLVISWIIRSGDATVKNGQHVLFGEVLDDL